VDWISFPIPTRILDPFRWNPDPNGRAVDPSHRGHGHAAKGIRRGRVREMRGKRKKIESITKGNKEDEGRK